MTPTVEDSEGGIRTEIKQLVLSSPNDRDDTDKGAVDINRLQMSYGADGHKHLDVTLLLTKLLRASTDVHGRVSLRDIPPATFGADPCPGLQKRLYITYVDEKNRERCQEVWEYGGEWVDPPQFLFAENDTGPAADTVGGSSGGGNGDATRGDEKTEVREKKERHPLNVFCQKVFVINLVRAAERRKRFTETCRSQGLEVEWVEAIDGHLTNFAYPANPRYGKYWNAGTAALCQTVLQLLQKVMLDPSVERIAIFEDDVCFTPTARTLLAEILPTIKPPLQWELLYLGHTRIGPASLPITGNPHLRRMRHQDGLAAHAYCIHRSLIPRLITELQSVRDPLDIIYYDLIFKRGKSFTVSPFVAYQGDTYSWILQEPTPWTTTTVF
jgi:hypothetical protein